MSNMFLSKYKSIRFNHNNFKYFILFSVTLECHETEELKDGNDFILITCRVTMGLISTSVFYREPKKSIKNIKGKV